MAYCQNVSPECIPKYKTPSYATIVTGAFVVSVPALFLNLTMVTDLCSIGTLFVAVCAGVLYYRIELIFQEGNLKHLCKLKMLFFYVGCRLHFMLSIIIVKQQWILLLMKRANNY
jgi:amino acid transporter